ncbi:cholecystokinin [Lampris incognitus]|uniref:cholecystokinin n=1 Tax=Lampris incognitus TaxID=2546036 RepID=UPI0024B54476|nr:cholecystokinin [Lampris incognitus]XP_056137040.1 cholecystokinin [Lampris incognitus]
MAVNGIMVCALVAALLVHGMASASQSPTDGDTRESGILQQLLATRGKTRNSKDSVARPDQKFQTRMTRMERLAHLSEDERELLTKQIMQTISEIMNSECMSDRDYQGWVDFGRRSTD